MRGIIKVVEGLKVAEIIRVDGNKSIIVTYKNLIFDIKKVADYEKKFNELKIDVSIDGNFEDDLWIINSISARFKMNFQCEFNKELNLAIKCFVVTELFNSKKNFRAVQVEIRRIYDVIYKTSTFDFDYFPIYEDNLEGLNTNTKIDINSSILSFLSFYHINDYKEYIEEISQFSYKHEKSSRRIPDYNSILKFDYVIKNYLSTCDLNGKNRYYPLLLWWTITRVVPLRPIEFVRIKKDCISIDSNGRCYLIVSRFKENHFIEKALNIKEEDTIRITKEVYDLIYDYRNICDKSEQYLISYNLYLSTMNKNNRMCAITRKYNPEIFWTSQLTTLIQAFYREVVSNYYNITNVGEKGEELNSIERIRAGDTRHLAFCSMMLQGLNPLTMARLGGHSNLNTQIGYYGHLDSFVDANISTLANEYKKLLNNNSKSYKIYNNVFNTREALVNRMVLDNEQSKAGLKEVEDGFCTSKDFPNECPPNTDCILCNKHLMDNSDEEFVGLKADYMSKVLKAKTIKQIEMLKGLLMKYKEDSKIDELIKETSEAISRTIGQRVVIDSYKIKSKEVNLHE